MARRLLFLPAREEPPNGLLEFAKEEPMDRARTLVAVLVAVALSVLVPVGLAYAGTPPPHPVPNPGTLLLFTSGLAGLAWWLRTRD